MNKWTDNVRAQALMLINQISLSGGKNSEITSIERSPYFSMLESLFSSDLEIAKIRDSSHLIIRIEGEAFASSPKLQLITSIFANVTNQVTDLTRAILGPWAKSNVSPSDIELNLNGLARGSFIIGLSAEPSPKEISGLLGEEDTLFVSTRRALQVIDDIAHVVEFDEEDISLEEISEKIPDPKVRDAGLVALQRLSPSGRRGIEKVTMASRDLRSPATINQNHRKMIRHSLHRPIISGEDLELIGVVREIDLDAKRFDLRGIDHEEMRDVRCAYDGIAEARPKALLGSMVRVRGLVERSHDNIPRLMAVNSISIIREYIE